MSYGPLALILVYTIHQSNLHVCTRFQFCYTHSSWEKCDKKFSLMEICKTYQGIHSKSYRPFAWFKYTLYNSPLSMCVPSFKFIGFIAPEKSVMKIFHLWQIVKLIKGFNSKSNGLLAMIMIYTSAHCPCVYPYSSWENVTKIFH